MLNDINSSDIFVTSVQVCKPIGAGYDVHVHVATVYTLLFYFTVIARVLSKLQQ